MSGMIFVVLVGYLCARWPDGRREQKGINLVCYGDPHGYTAMAKTVGYPCAIATKMVGLYFHNNFL
jgi:alpha-aminoadipic semialdehyde synthase